MNHELFIIRFIFLINIDNYYEYELESLESMNYQVLFMNNTLFLVIF